MKQQDRRHGCAAKWAAQLQTESQEVQYDKAFGIYHC